jgi:hypothetical protein
MRLQTELDFFIRIPLFFILGVAAMQWMLEAATRPPDWLMASLKFQG